MKNKELLESFIDKFYLGGVNERAIIHAYENKTDVLVYNKQTACGAEIYLNKNIFNNLSENPTELAVYNVGSFIRLLKPFEDPNIFVGFKSENINDTDPFFIGVEENEISARYVLSKPMIIDNRQKLDPSRFEWNAEFNLSEDKYNEIMSFVGSLKGFDTFSFKTKAGKLYLKFGGQRNSSENKVEIQIPVSGEIKSFKSQIKFNIDIFKSILHTNKGADISIKFNDMLYNLTATTKHFTCIYYNSSKK